MDTTASAGQDGVDSVITYSADAIDFDILTRTTILEGNARINYKDMELTAGRILLNWDEQIMIATALPESVFVDSLKAELDTVILIEPPHFKQGSEEFTGEEIAYNLKSKIGRVKGGRTAYQDGSYYGEQFKRISDDVLTVRHGEFTTCELDTPHFHFGSNVLKIEVGERVIARPVYLYFEDVPVLALPYGIFPVQKGRTSGFITPVFGESASQGRSLRNIGYYWATSDYMDVLGTMDYYETHGVLARSKYRYAKRYHLSGNIDFDLDTQRSGASRNRRWQMSANHNQTIDPNTRISASGAYVSDKSYRKDVGSVNDQLNQTIRSNATLSKSWNNSPWTASLNAGFTQNIAQETWSAILPAVRFTHKQGQLFPPPKAPKGIRFAAAPKESVEPWYRSFTWTYGAAYTNDIARPLTFQEIALRPEPVRIDGKQGTPTVILGDDSLGITQRDGVGHNGSVGATAKLFGYLNLNPSLDWKHVWTRRVLHYEPNGTLLEKQTKDGFFTRTTFDLGSSASTKLYGLARNPFGVGAQFRHVMTPTVSFRYRPDFADEKWGYYETATLADGREYMYDRFRSSEQGSTVGGTEAGLSQSMSFSLGNLFQMKYGNAEDKTEKKFDLLAANFSTAVDFKKDSLKWSDLSSSFRTSLPNKLIGPIEGVGFDVSTVHSLYERRGNTAVNNFFWERDNASWFAPFDLLRASGSVDVSIGSETVGDLLRFSSGGEELKLEDSTAAQGEPNLPPPPGAMQTEEDFELPPLPQAEESDEPSTFIDMPVSLRFNLRHARDYIADSKTSTLGATLNSQLTPRWGFDFNYYFDLDRRIAQNASLTITRDLHCWEAALSWSPAGYSPGYFLRIGLKSPQLQDVKIERNRGGNIRGF